MDDREIVSLYWAREERAIRETDSKYGKMLYRLSEGILHSPPDSEEALNDAYLAAWNSMPQNRPDHLGSYMAKIIRNLSLNRYEKQRAEKRGGNAVLCELTDCIPAEDDPLPFSENDELRKLIERFLSRLDREKRTVFIKRYFFSKPLSEISEETGLSEGKLKTMLFRLRMRLREDLKEVGR